MNLMGPGIKSGSTLMSHLVKHELQMVNHLAYHLIHQVTRHLSLQMDRRLWNC